MYNIYNPCWDPINNFFTTTVLDHLSVFEMSKEKTLLCAYRITKGFELAESRLFFNAPMSKTIMKNHDPY